MNQPPGYTLDSIWLTLRSLLWTILLPGVVAGYLPWQYFGVKDVPLDFSNPIHVGAIVVIGIGSGLLVWCIWEFAHSGKGTLAPVDAPTRLVVQGLYRHVRNPMYLSVSTIVLGEVLLTRSLALFFYWIAFFTAANLFVIGYEEPALRRRFGDSYEAYTREVGRWVPRGRIRE